MFLFVIFIIIIIVIIIILLLIIVDTIFAFINISAAMNTFF